MLTLKHAAAGGRRQTLTPTTVYQITDLTRRYAKSIVYFRMILPRFLGKDRCSGSICALLWATNFQRYIASITTPPSVNENGRLADFATLRDGARSESADLITRVYCYPTPLLESDHNSLSLPGDGHCVAPNKYK